MHWVHHGARCAQVPDDEQDGERPKLTCTKDGRVYAQDVWIRSPPAPVAIAGPLEVTGTFYPAVQAVALAAPAAVTGTFWQSTQPVSGPLTDAQLRAAPVPVSGTFFPATQAVSGTFWQATQPVSGPLTDAQLRAAPVPVTGSFSSAPQASTLCVSATAAISQAVTATLPAVAGQFHYITAIEVVSYAGAAIATAAAAVAVTTTNLPGSLALNHQRLHSAGQSFSSGVRVAGNPLKSSASGVATTVVCPVLTGCIWRVNVTYYTAP
jgi:hypothetical protein